MKMKSKTNHKLSKRGVKHVSLLRYDSFFLFPPIENDDDDDDEKEER